MTRIVRGKFSHRPRNDPSLYDGPHPFIQTGDVARAGKHITTWEQTLNELGRTVSKAFPKGTLVMSIAANVGDVAILDFSAYFPDSVVGFVPSSRTRLEYLYYLFTAMRPALLSTATVNTQANLNVDRIGAIVVPVPPVEEQDAIVAYVERALGETRKIDETLSKQLERLREYRQALITAAVTGR